MIVSRACKKNVFSSQFLIKMVYVEHRFMHVNMYAGSGELNSNANHVNIVLLGIIGM